ncbi:translocation and assembly module lipoprotein TamL [Hyunsoonleella pacifica]|uniref:Outer membrane protein assembly factor n=1 Tax=Hyunsoonleella pacifica TaxID=1080224 RepID=A0A4V2JAX4_9FLAO|nr:BamA/TamA family outer membrane protein [Hyunsoonleella pacifica]TBN15545.1 outer membrane protein assembly factor [Hyunsoonleella pacifica]GGD24917.1 membrane protein [Hyunsoonleella pacifica]
MLSSCFTSCNTVKRVAKDEHLLTNNTIVIDGKKNKSELLNSLIYQKPNSKIPLRLGIYNLARPNIDSILTDKLTDSSKKGLKRFLSKKQYYKMQESKLHFNQWLKKTGEAPVILNEDKTKKSVKRLQDYYINNGWFNVSGNYNIERGDNKRAEVTYNIEKGPAFIIDSISENIASPAVETLYPRFRKNALVKKGEQYKTINFELERERISGLLRNHGLFHFKQDYITVEIDTIGTNNKVNVNFNIQNRAVRTPDSILRKPFKIFKVKDVNVYTDHTFANKGTLVKDSITYNNFKLYSYGDMRFKPKAITDAIFIAPNSLFKDIDRTYTYRHLNELRTFKYPDIEYVEENDTTLTANIYLTPLKKFSLGFSTEASTSNIQRVGLALNPSLTIRNIFKGAETFEISGTAAIGSSVEPNRQVGDPFFDINELALDLRLTIPRLFSPFNTEKIIPKYMSPSTRITLSGSGQTNIGLDKQALSGIFSYNWRPNTKVTNQLDLFNIQYVRNLNTDNYFDIYTTSFRRLNDIAQSINYTGGSELSKPEGAETFISDVLNNNTALNSSDEDFRRVSAINERKDRLTEDNLILSTSFNFIKDNRTSLLDEDFSIFRFRIESAGTLLANASKLLGLKKDANDRFNIFDVAFSQYIKTEFDYVKRWDLGKQNIFAIRSFFGIAIPYGNSDNIPFAKSFFGGGANDNRAWTAYALGPGSSESTDEFNEANLKIALSAEQRFNLFGSLNGALFVDAGNIWNALDDVNDPRATFSGLNSLRDIAVGSGFGLRYDFSFFLFRFDVGFKTYDPSYRDENRWFNDYNFKNAVYNIGINYPF